MKKILFFILISVITFSCKKNAEKEDEKVDKSETAVEINSAEDKIYRGDFIYVGDAEVFDNEGIYLYDIIVIGCGATQLPVDMFKL